MSIETTEYTRNYICIFVVLDLYLNFFLKHLSYRSSVMKSKLAYSVVKMHKSVYYSVYFDFGSNKGDKHLYK